MASVGVSFSVEPSPFKAMARVLTRLCINIQALRLALVELGGDAEGQLARALKELSETREALTAMCEAAGLDDPGDIYLPDVVNGTLWALVDNQ